MAKNATIEEFTANVEARIALDRNRWRMIRPLDQNRTARRNIARPFALTLISLAVLSQPVEGAETKDFCTPINSSVRNFPHVGLVVTVEKCDATVSTVAGRLFKDGKQISASEFAVIEQAESAALYTERGALDESLDAQLSECQKGTRKSVAVVAWARTLSASPYDKNSDPKIKLNTAEPWAIVASQIGLIASCASAKAQDCQLLENVPVAFMKVDCDQVGTLAFDSNVGRIFAVGELTPATTYCPTDCQGIFPNVVKNLPPFVYNFPPSTAILGQGTKTCVIDSENIDTLQFNPGLTRMNPAAPTGLHARMTVGIVQSINPVVPGIANSCDVFLANYLPGSQDIFNSAIYCTNHGTGNWAIVLGDSYANGAVVGALQDYYYRNTPWPFITSPAGNEGAAAPTNQPTTLNSLVVGSTDDKASAVRADDTMNPSSNGANPASPHNDRETPHIVAPGFGVFSSGLCGCGTSLSTPMVAATGALVEQINPYLSNWPEVKRAIILTGADENIAGTVNPLGGAGSNSADGVGELNVQLSLTIAKAENVHGMAGIASRYGYDYGAMAPFTNWYNGAQQGLSDGYRVTVPAGVTGANLRAVLVWDATACAGVENGACASSTADADLDLYVCKVGTSECWFSATYDNTWEMVQKSVVVGEAYNIYIYSYAFTAPFTYFSVAWAVDTYGVAP